MRYRTRILLIASASLLAGCSEMTSFETAKGEAEDRWNDVRCKLKCELASESFEDGRMGDARTHVEEAIGLDPEAHQPYILLTRILLEHGETAAAGKALAIAVTKGGASARTDYLHGLIAERYGHHDQALEWFRSASAREPMDAHYVEAVAETLVAMNRQDEALRLIQERWTDLEHNATLRSLAGEIHFLAGDYDKAARAYRQAVRIAPDDLTLKSQLGLSLTFARSYHEGRVVLAEVVRDDGEPSAVVLSALGQCHLILNEHDDAKRVLTQATRRSPNNDQYWALLAQASLGAGDLITARAAATRACETGPRRPEITMLMAHVCWRQQDYASAIHSLEQVLRHQPDEAIALCMLGRCHEKSGNADAARDCYRRVLASQPAHALAQQLLDRMPKTG